MQELENQKLIGHMSNELTAWHENRTKNPTKFWKKGDICVAQRSSDGKYHRAEIQRVCQKQRKCLVNENNLVLLSNNLKIRNIYGNYFLILTGSVR